MFKTRPWLAVATFALFAFANALGAQCPTWPPPNANNVLYLYYPTAVDASFPEFGAGFGFPTSPAEPFDVVDLATGIGSTADVRDAITEVVSEDYCEFDVEVVETTSNPSPTDPRWQIIAIGSDTDAPFGLAQAVDTNDADPQDHARVWSQRFLDICGGAGGALAGANSTLGRWANAIGGTTSHEAGHNYGLAHGDSAPRPGSGEDGTNNHILATGSTGLTCNGRVLNRHFSDISYEILAANIGLRAKTVHNWDFVNPNADDASKLKITILSTAPALTLTWWYMGLPSPWGMPTITGPTGTQTFQGTSYNVFVLEFSVPKTWSGATPGVVTQGEFFHTGAAFAESDPIIVTATELCDVNGNPLLLHPRVFGYDTADIDVGDGSVGMNLFNMQPELGPLEVRNLTVQRLPRQAHIESMFRDQSPFSLTERLPIEPWSVEEFGKIELGKFGATIAIGSMAEERSVQFEYSKGDCENKVASKAAFDMPQGYPELDYCHDGWVVGALPSASVYITATVVDPLARQWDPELEQYVVAPLETRVYYQFAGIVPDLNRNGTDDFLDIQNGTSKDWNRNGVPDEVEEGGGR